MSFILSQYLDPCIEDKRHPYPTWGLNQIRVVLSLFGDASNGPSDCSGVHVSPPFHSSSEYLKSECLDLDTWVQFKAVCEIRRQGVLRPEQIHHCSWNAGRLTSLAQAVSCGPGKEGEG
jgi:hypothetical protein